MVQLIVLTIVVAGIIAYFDYRLCRCSILLYAGLFIGAAILIPVFDWLADYVGASDTEWHGGIVRSAIWDEHWTEEYEVTVTDYDDKGNAVGSHTEKRWTFHPDKYVIHDSNGYEVDVNLNKYKELQTKFANEVTEKPWRSGQSSWGDGRRFTTTWPGNKETITPCFTAHRYENRIVNSYSILKTREADASYKVYDYPEIFDFHKQQSLVGFADSLAECRLMLYNVQRGSVKQIRLFLLIFDNNDDIQYGVEQRMHWQGGNKNEVVVCIGKVGDEISWVYPFCWSNEDLKASLKDEIASLQKFDIHKIIDIITQLTESKFSREEFAKYSYIEVKKPWWMYAIAGIMIVLIPATLAYWEFKH